MEKDKCTVYTDETKKEILTTGVVTGNGLKGNKYHVITVLKSNREVEEYNASHVTIHKTGE